MSCCGLVLPYRCFPSVRIPLSISRSLARYPTLMSSFPISVGECWPRLLPVLLPCCLWQVVSLSCALPALSRLRGSWSTAAAVTLRLDGITHERLARTCATDVQLPTGVVVTGSNRPGVQSSLTSPLALPSWRAVRSTADWRSITQRRLSSRSSQLLVVTEVLSLFH